MARDDLAARRGLTFGQAEGLEPLPKQLNKTAMPGRLRSRLWDEISRLLDHVTVSAGYGYEISWDWYSAIRNYYVDKTGYFGDQFPAGTDHVHRYVREIIATHSYVDVYNIIQVILQVNSKTCEISSKINNVLEKELSAYRVYDGDIIASLASEFDADTIQSALEKTTQVGAQGPRAHIRNSIQALNNSDFSSSVRESIGAVESLSKILASNPKAELTTALSILEKSTNIHGGMKSAFAKLYGYTSDEKGIRHALLFEGKANVDEADALFMLGACSAFVTYLITRASQADASVIEQT